MGVTHTLVHTNTHTGSALKDTGGASFEAAVKVVSEKQSLGVAEGECAGGVITQAVGLWLPGPWVLSVTSNKSA